MPAVAEATPDVRGPSQSSVRATSVPLADTSQRGSWRNAGASTVLRNYNRRRRHRSRRASVAAALGINARRNALDYDVIAHVATDHRARSTTGHPYSDARQNDGFRSDICTRSNSTFPRILAPGATS